MSVTTSPVSPISVSEEASAGRQAREPAAVRSAPAAGRARSDRLLARDPQGRDPRVDPRQPAVLRRAPGDLRRDRAAGRPGARADRLLAAARVQARAVRVDDPAEPDRVRDAGDPRLPALDSTPIHPATVIRIRKDPAHRRFGRLRGGPLASAARVANDRADHAAGAGAGADRDPAARPRHRPGLHDGRVHDPDRGRHLVEAADHAIRDVRGVGGPGARGGARRWASTC